MVGEDGLVRDRAIGQRLQPAGQAGRVQQPGVVLEQAHELPAAELEGQAVEVAQVHDQRIGLRRHRRVVQRAEHRRRRGIHHDDRQTRLRTRPCRPARASGS